MKEASGRGSEVHVLRLLPGDDLRPTLERWVRSRGIEAACVVSAVGSLSHAHIRHAGRADGITTSGDLEICSLSGTLAMDGLHLHISVADPDGKMDGGHVLPGCIVRTTLEVVIQRIEGIRMLRSKDTGTGYNELDPRGTAP